MVDNAKLLLVAKAIGNGGGSSVTVEPLSVSANGAYSASSGYAYNPVNVSVPQVSLTSLSVTENGIYSAPEGTAYNAVDVSVPTGGGFDAEDGIIMRTISGAYENSRVTSIGSCAFYYCSSLTTASFPSATSIGNSAFYFCTSLTTASFPSATTIGGNAFYSCTRLTTVSFPLATSIGGSAFYYCSSLTTASFPSATSIGNSAFQNCYSLTTVSFPLATTIGGNAFYKCYNLISFYLLGSSVATLSNSNAFNSTPIGGYTTSTSGVYGSIYVPSSLLASYKAATNWVNLSARFVGVSV